MKEVEEKTTVPNPSVDAEKEQPLVKETTTILPKDNAEFNEKDEEHRKMERLFQQVNNPRYLHTVSMSELYDTVYRTNPRIVDDFLYAGTYLFVGAPKVGKSFFMAQLSYHVSTGLPLWGHHIHKGTVLYLALEDDYARLQKRLSRMFGTEGNDNLYFAVQAKQLNEGLDGQLDEFVRQHPDTRLIIIDTLQKVREIGGDKYSYASDYEIVTKLKKFSDQHGVCLLLVHHTRKQVAEDSFDTISGTNGLLGAADGAFVLQKIKRTGNEAVLDVAGRDQQDQKLYLKFDRESCVWQLIKAETELWKEPVDAVVKAVAKLVTAEKLEWKGSASELADVLDGVKLSPNALTRRLNVSAGCLLDQYGIRYENRRSHMGRQVKLTFEKTAKA